MNNPGDSLQIDENLARMLAACDQAMDGADPKAPTIGVPTPPVVPLPGERQVGPLSGGEPNEGSYGEVLPDTSRHSRNGSGRHLESTLAPAAQSPRVGRFELRRQLGKGGCGIVFLAFDPKLQREVALKIPRPEMLLSQDARRRLIREALAAAEFDHPNLVPVYETGEIGPICFIATAFCPGQTLGEWLDKQAFPVPVRQAARLVATVAEAVQHAHDRGVLHRDLKPNNVILQATKEDPDQTEPPPGSCQLRGDCFIARVVDFGLAKLLERGGPSETATRQILGTPKYMAPEQAQARHEDVGPAADVYALGVILYEMIAGRAPYEGATDVEVLRQAIDGNLVHPHHLRPDVPRDLEAICLKAMERVPGKRYRTAIDLADDLRRFLEGKPTIARPLKWPARAGRWLRRNDQAVAVVVLAVVTTLLLVIGSWSMYQNEQFRRDHASVQRDLEQRTRADHHRDYARNVRAAYLAWRAGDIKASADSLEAARRIAQTAGEPTDFPHDYLSHLLSAERLTVPCPAGPITSISVSLEGSRFATGHSDGTVALWETNRGLAIASARAHEGPVRQVRFLPSGEVVTADARGHAKAWTQRAGTLEATSSLPMVEVLALSPALIVRHTKGLFVAGDDGVVRVYDPAVVGALSPPHTVPERVTALAVGSEDEAVAVATRTPAAIRLGNGRGPATLASGRKFDHLWFGPEGRLAGIESRDGGVAISELGSVLREARRIPLPAGGVRLTSADLSPDKLYLALGDSRGRATVVSIADGTLLLTVETGSSDAVTRVAVSDGGRLVATRTEAGVQIWSAPAGGLVATLTGADAALLRFLPAGDRLATASSGGPLRVWSGATGQEEWTFYGHVGRVTGLGGSPDGRTLVSGSVGGEVRFWDLRTGQELMAFQRHGGAVTHVEFGERGLFLTTAGESPSGEGEVASWRGVRP